MPLREFDSEDEFRQKFIRPLLQRLGYILVTHSHGTDEHGKDLFFADFDRFEHPRFYSVQAKNGNIGVGNGEIGKLMDQVRASFEVPISTHKGTESQRICAVYVMASGSISSQARTRITSECRSAHYGENVYFLDGDRLETIGKFATYRDDQQTRRTLAALQSEIKFNTRRAKELIKVIDDLAPSHLLNHLRLSALEHALAEPPPEDLLSYALLESLWTAVAGTNNVVLFSQAAGLDPLQLPAVRGATQRTIQICEHLETKTTEAISRLDGRYNMALRLFDR